ncbi:MAG: hypothetical protein GYB53_01425 [Rhodobacteraceae bacterium]|nr:hypothetical protein [Paracoccaceae bacterium]MBR9819929.1 hypothetical protein [Paracoccaceae bacterium]
MKQILFATLTAVTALSGAAYATPGNGHNNGKGWGVGHVPPGHQKKMHRYYYAPGDRLPEGYMVIRDYDRYGLQYPGDGYRYVRYDNEVYRVMRDTATVAAAIGIVSDLLNN